MVASLLLSFFSTVLSYFSSVTKDKRYLALCFILIFVFLGVRYDFGNDFFHYRDNFILIQKLDIKQAFDLDIKKEYGFILLNKLVSYIGGYTTLLLLLSLANSIVYYKFITRYNKSETYYFSVFLYIMTPGLLLIQSSAIRQTIVILLFLSAIDFLYKKKFIKYLLVIFLASFFHKSALFLALLVFIPFLTSINPKRLSIVYLSLYFFTLFFPEMITELLTIDLIRTDNYDLFNIQYDEIYLKSEEVKLGFGALLITVIFLLTLYSFTKIHKSYRILYNIFFIYFISINLTYSIPMLGRLTMYFMPLLIVVYPEVISSFKSYASKLIVQSIIVFYYLFEFYQFFITPRWQSFFEYNMRLEL